MSVKDFFAFASIKLLVVEFLKAKTDFTLLHHRFKKPFRAHINKHDLSDFFFVSDGFNSVKCGFTPKLQESFE